jgi:TrpR-related protein YerC/YecD
MEDDKILLEELYQAFIKLETKEECESFLADLCTKTELFSMSQRLAAAKMLLDGKTYSEVTEATEISSGTLSKVSRCVRYGAGGYKRIIEK